MSFNIALSGLTAVSSQLGTISHNIANAGTTGFKSSRADFGSVYADSQALGVEVLGQTQSMSQNGTLVATGRTLDLAISGGGFFVTRGTDGQTNYTRAGVFNADRENFLVGAAGQRLQGYPADDQGNLQVGTVGDLQLRTSNLPASATTSLEFVANLNADDAVIPAPVAPDVFDPSDVDQFNSTYTTKVFDSLGREHTLTQYFAKRAEGEWEAHYYIDGAAAGTPQMLNFGTDGELTAPVDGINVGAPMPGAEALDIEINYQGSSQYGSEFVVTANRPDGYSAGEQTGMAVEKDGKVYATYSNGQRLLQGQLVLANFVNPQGLNNVSGTAWVETSESGQALLGVPGIGQNGAIASGTLENSNVDLTEQLVGLMEAQRNYQANTRVLSTDRELTQALFNVI